MMVQELKGGKRLRDYNGFGLTCLKKSLRSNELNKEIDRNWGQDPLKEKVGVWQRGWV